MGDADDVDDLGDSMISSRLLLGYGALVLLVCFFTLVFTIVFLTTGISGDVHMSSLLYLITSCFGGLADCSIIAGLACRFVGSCGLDDVI